VKYAPVILTLLQILVAKSVQKEATSQVHAVDYAQFLLRFQKICKKLLI
jgi:hypothetical protein